MTDAGHAPDNHAAKRRKGILGTAQWSSWLWCSCGFATNCGMCWALHREHCDA